MENITLFQFFHWYYSAEGNLWQHARDEAGQLAEWGITYVWLPPAYKSFKGTEEPGYAVYDLYDLGEFNQHGSIRTRYGTKEEYLECIQAFHSKGVKVLADIVLNHRLGGDKTELVPVRKVNTDNRNEYLSDAIKIEAHTKFTFPARKGKYSNFTWDWHTFTGVCNDDNIYVILNEYSKGKWEEMLETENGNYDYLMGNDVEFRNPYVRKELKKWGSWYTKLTGIDGYRLDALKHITPDFFPEWLDFMKHHFRKDFFCVGEYWQNNVYTLMNYFETTGERIRLFDVPLHFNFYDASQRGNEYDLRQIFDNALVNERPEAAITFVDNHDTQPLQALQSTVEYWFKPLANAMILLRDKGIPCVFYPTLYEAKYVDMQDGMEVYVELNRIPAVGTMMKIRKLLAYGPQHDYFSHANMIGWTREGVDEKASSGCAVLLSNGEDGQEEMSLGIRNANKTFVDVCGNRAEKVTLDENGVGVFFVNGRSVSVWINDEAKAQLDL